MDQNLGGNSARSANQGNEDASEAQRHVQNAEENHDALAAQNRRVEESTPTDLTGSDRGASNVGGTSTGGRAGGMDAAGTSTDQGSEDASAAREHVRNVEENRDALEAQNRRVEATAPEETRHDLRDQR
jgi:hypothetical protein